MQDPTISIQLRSITHSYDARTRPVLDDVNITVMKGSIYCLLGPSGCGKTTVLKVFCVLLMTFHMLDVSS